jgi:large subunit ribosomal protein L19
MDLHALIKGFESKQLKKNVADVRVGETVRVHYKIREGNKERIQIFEGLVITTPKGRSLQGSFTVRKVVGGIGVERIFPLHSPWITKIERIKSGKIRQAKLYFVRRHAASPKRFRLKDKGVAGTIWQAVAEEQEAIERGKAEEEAEIAATPQAEEQVDEAVTSDEVAEQAAQKPAEAEETVPEEAVSGEEEAK